MSHGGDGDSSDPHGRIPAGAVLLVKNGFYEGLEVMLERSPTVIGRGRAADLVIVEPTISREHAELGFDANGFYVRDLGSTNGTHVNGQRAERLALKDGDEIHMGKLVVGVTLPG